MAAGRGTAGHLAVGLVEAGDLAEAARLQRQAIETAPPARRAAMRSRLGLYREGKPFRDTPPQR